MKKQCIIIFILLTLLFTLFTAGCKQADEHVAMIDEAYDYSHDENIHGFKIPIPTAPGINVETDGIAVIDYSNMQDGYIIAGYNEKSEHELKIIVTPPNGDQYIYALGDMGKEEIIPLTEGDGEYQIKIYQRIDDDHHQRLFETTIIVKLTERFAPFIRPNQFVNYTQESHLVRVASELTKDAENTYEMIDAIYIYVADNFEYDYDLAKSVQNGYLPNLDRVLDRKKGICIDYAALVTAMLRSQGIPTMLEIGYYGEEYHAWISVHCEENGWIENRYHHNGEDWSMMDPTLASGERAAHMSRKEARDDAKYEVMFNY